ncbi:ROK family protein [Marinobacter bryozoorum]|uniref:ROK family protein n=1 Tax=Marinobacter bryozoorum TaxID=256324 RepID=UPI002003D133|nr:ROK family protein [Marinobacter bryozoorum]MCK7543149.1 ROK family protein [Marinobacter bryozoorum]
MTSDWLIGVDLGGTKTEVILLDSASREHFRMRQPTPKGDYQGTLATIVRLVQEAEAHSGSSCPPVGVGIPGFVSGLTGRVKNGNSTWLNGQPMAADLTRLLSRPVTLANDANCLALSEATDGAGEGYGVVFAAILGTGCGAGISVNGQLLTGPNGVAGEWGHNPLPWTSQVELDRRPCFCGRLGCNETFLSGTGMALTHQLMWQEARTSEQVVAEAARGDSKSAQTLELYLDHLARGLASVINLLDPDVIVLGGGLSNVAAIYQQLPGRLGELVFGGECQTPVVRAAHGDSSGVRGAAWLARSQA